MSQPLPASARSLTAALKRRLYITGSALGLCLSVLYDFSILHEGVTAAFMLSTGIMLELLVFLLLFALAPQWVERLEVFFFFVMVVSLIVLGGGQIAILYARRALSPDKLGFMVNSLVLWLTICQLGAFLALPFRMVRQLLALIWVSMALLVASAALVMRPPAEWRYSYLISWVAGLIALYIVSLQISWLGQRQQRHATTDSLTGVANRHLLSELIASHHERAAAQRRGYAVMLIDIDLFKTINDSYGHATGDRVLANVAAAIKRHIREADRVGRWGGDEFLVLLADADLGAAQEVAERVRAAAERLAFGDGSRPTLSIGVHAYRPGQGIEEVLACADQALYQVKQAGRNQVGLWSPQRAEGQGEKSGSTAY